MAKGSGGDRTVRSGTAISDAGGYVEMRFWE